MNKKLKTPKALKSIISKLKKQGGKIVFTNGCFDILHVGHISYLEKAKSYGDTLIIGLNSDLSVKKLKGKDRPLFSQKERAKALSGLVSVDYVIIFNEDTPEKLIGELKPDIHVKGGDYTPGELPEAKIVAMYGGKVKIVKYIPGFSTTNIIKKLKKIGI
ncbi:MAG: D-glycero-beta-D-manno-heptose 1-phosphate adenylyltransferase [Armatimonadota bacterium]